MGEGTGDGRETPCEKFGNSTIHYAGHDKDAEPWPREAITLISNGFTTNWSGTLPPGWFSYNGFAGFNDLVNVIAMGTVPLIGVRGTIVWLQLPDVNNKRWLVNKIIDIRSMIYEVDCKSIVFFVTHVPLRNHRLRIINHNKNLLFALRKIRREMKLGSTRAIALHHWCLKQNKLWAELEDVSVADINMLLFLIVSEVSEVLKWE